MHAVYAVSQAWVDQLLGASRMFRDRLAAMESLGADTLLQVCRC